MMFHICTHCAKEVEVKVEQSIETILVRDENIHINSKYLVCQECGMQFHEPSFDPLKEAFKLYRDKHNLLQPERIKKIREDLSLTQREFSKLLGFGEITIARYEKGSLQSNTHDSLIRESLTQDGLQKYLDKNGANLSPEKVKEIRAKVSYVDKKIILQEAMGKILSSPPGKYNGQSKFNYQKLHAALSYFCSPLGEWKTKVNKYLFYLEFIHFKYYGRSVCGLAFIHDYYGPVPDEYEGLLALIIENGFELTEVPINESYMGDKICIENSVGLEVLESTEMKVLKYVKNHFKSFSSRQISDYSHNEDAYKKTNMKEKISYEFSSTLHVQFKI